MAGSVTQRLGREETNDSCAAARLGIICSSKILSEQASIGDTNFDRLVEQIEHVIQNPNEGRSPKVSETTKAARGRRLEELKDFAEALKNESPDDSECLVAPARAKGPRSLECREF